MRDSARPRSTATVNFYAVRVGDVEISFDGMEQIELDTTDSAGWWTPDELDADGTAGFHQLTAVMRSAVSGAAGRC